MSDYYAVTAPSPDILRQEVQKSIDASKDDPRRNAETRDIAIHVTMPCGEQYLYETVQDIPEEPVDCRCGDPEHHVIGYFPN